MDREKRRKIAFIVLLIIGALAAVFMFVWGAYLNRGYIVFSGDAPFHVEVFGVEEFECPTSPCSIKQKIGSKDLIITKDGYQSFLLEVDVPFLREEKVDLEFSIIPYIQSVTTLPQVSKTTYELKYDDKEGMYKLIETEDPQQRAIVFFPKELKEPLIFGSNSTVLVVEQGRSNSAYKINVQAKSKEKIALDLTGITAGSFSPSGDLFVFETAENESLQLLKGSTVKSISLEKGLAKYYWLASNDLAFATIQVASPAEKSGQYQNYVSVSSEVSFLGVSFGVFRTAENAYTLIETFPEFTKLPENFYAGSNGKVYYFTEDELNYKILLD